MSLKRKARTVGGSLNVVIPSQIAELHNIQEGTLLEFKPLEQGKFRIETITDPRMCRVMNQKTGETKNIKRTNGMCIPPAGWKTI